METLLLLALLAPGPDLAGPATYPDQEEFVTAAGATGDVCLPDDTALAFGGTCAAPIYWLEYDISETRLELWGTDTNGSGADAMLIYVDDGTSVWTSIGGVHAFDQTSVAIDSVAIEAHGEVSLTGDTGKAIAVDAISTDTHAGGENLGVRINAANGNNDWALWIVAGDFKSVAALDWQVIDNTSEALRIGAGGAPAILGIDSTNGSERATLSDDLQFTGGGSIVTTSNGDVVFAPHGSGVVEMPAFFAVGGQTTGEIGIKMDGGNGHCREGDDSGDCDWIAKSLTASGNGGLTVAAGGTMRYNGRSRRTSPADGKHLWLDNGEDGVCWDYTTASQVVLYDDDCSGDGGLEVTGAMTIGQNLTIEGNHIIIGDEKALVDAVATDFVRVNVAQGGHAHGTIWYSLFVAENGDTDLQSMQGMLTFSAVNEGGTIDCDIQKGFATPIAGTESYAKSDAASTLTVAFTCVEDVADTIDIAANANTSFAATDTFEIEFSVKTAEDYTVTAL
jgi:hypothetical protein